METQIKEWYPRHTIYPLNLQQMFENAIQAFVEEKRTKSFNTVQRYCSYSRKFNGCGCAIGVSMPDDTSEEIRNALASFDVLIDRFGKFCNKHFNISTAEGEQLQSVHDFSVDTNFNAEIIMYLYTFGINNKLKIPEILLIERDKRLKEIDDQNKYQANRNKSNY